MQKKRDNKGFLLLEVVASIAVVAIGLTLILRSFVSSMRASKISQEYFEAACATQEKISGIRMVEKLDGGVVPEETIDKPSGTGFTLTTKVVRIKDTDPLSEVSAVCSWKGKEREERLSVGTYTRGR